MLESLQGLLLEWSYALVMKGLTMSLMFPVSCNGISLGVQLTAAGTDCHRVPEVEQQLLKCHVQKRRK